MAPPWTEQIQKQSQFNNTNGKPMAHTHQHRTFGSSCRLWPEWNAYCCLLRHWSFRKILGYGESHFWKRNIVGESLLWERIIHRQWIVQCWLISGKTSSFESANQSFTGHRHLYHLLTQNGSFICFPCSSLQASFSLDTLSKSFNLGQVLLKSNILFIHKENKF